MCMAICKDRNVLYRLLRGTSDGPEYRNQLFNKVIGKTNNRGILMDNASIHKTKKITQELLTNNI